MTNYQNRFFYQIQDQLQKRKMEEKEQMLGGSIRLGWYRLNFDEDYLRFVYNL